MLFAANSFNLPPEIAVQQLEMNLRNYRLYSADNKDDFGNPDHSAAPELKGTRIEGSHVTASILMQLSQALMQLDPPAVVMATLRAAEAQLIRKRLEAEKTALRGVQNAARKAGEQKKDKWVETFMNAAERLQEANRKQFCDGGDEDGRNNYVILEERNRKALDAFKEHDAPKHSYTPEEGPHAGKVRYRSPMFPEQEFSTAENLWRHTQTTPYKERQRAVHAQEA